MMYGYTLLVLKNQRVLNKLSEGHNISGHKWSTTNSVLKSYRDKKGVMRKIYVIMKIMPSKCDIYIYIYMYIYM